MIYVIFRSLAHISATGPRLDVEVSGSSPIDWLRLNKGGDRRLTRRQLIVCLHFQGLTLQIIKTVLKPSLSPRSPWKPSVMWGYQSAPQCQGRPIHSLMSCKSHNGLIYSTIYNFMCLIRRLCDC